MPAFNTQQYTSAHLALLPAPAYFRGFLTGIGSRKTPPPAKRILTVFAAVMYSQGYIWRSGGADGADEAIEEGVVTHPHYHPGQPPPMEIYLPWNGFEAIPGSGKKKWHRPDHGYFDTKRFPLYEQAQQITLRTHPAPEILQQKQGVFALHTRNVFQVLGQELNTPSKRVYLWAPPTKDDLVTGGTRTAVALAAAYKIPRVNLAKEASLTSIVSFLERIYHGLDKRLENA